MPKRISYIVVITILALLGIFMSKRFMSPSHSKQQQNTSSSSPSSKKKPLQTNPIKKNEERTTSQIGKAGIDTNLSIFLGDSKVNAEDRVYRVRDLNLNTTTSIGKENIKELVTFINSENPYAHDPQARRPHSAKAYQFKKEASLRVYSMKRLSQSLPLTELEAQIQNIIKGSHDPTIVKIAKQVLQAKQNGKNYFENMKQGLRSMGGPDHHHGGETSHSHN